MHPPNADGYLVPWNSPLAGTSDLRIILPYGEGLHLDTCCHIPTLQDWALGSPPQAGDYVSQP